MEQVYYKKIGEYQNVYDSQDALLFLAVVVNFKIDMNVKHYL